MMLIPFPIPEPDRTWLIYAGEQSVRQNHTPQARKDVDEIIDGIRKKYGIEEVE